MKLQNIVKRLMLVLMLCTVFVAAGMDAQAQTTNPVDGSSEVAVEEAAINVAKTIYYQFRLPICLLGLLFAVFSYMSSDRDGKGTAIRIVIAVILFALVPSILALLESWTTGFGQIG